MAAVGGSVSERPAATAVLATIVGYTLVIGTFADVLPIYPSIDLHTSTMLSHAIAVVNALTVSCLAVGWFWIRQGRVRRHRQAMTSAFVLIMLFLVLYLTRVGGGGTKHFVGPDLVSTVYLAMLAIHILLSIFAVPLVLYALLLGLTRAPSALPQTRHPQIGRLAVTSWMLSLLLGLVTYVMLEHLYGWEYVAALVPMLP